MGADYYALSEQPELQVTLPGLPMVVQQSFINQNSGGAHGIVTQPLYTSGRISSGIAAAQSQVSANCDDLRRTVLDVKMNVAEYYVVVLSATKFVQVAQSKVLQPHGPPPRRGQFVREGTRVQKRSSGGGSGPGRCPTESARHGQQTGSGPGRLQPRLGTNLTASVQLAELQDDGGRWDVNALTAQAMQQRPELAARPQARALQQQAESERGKTGPQVAVQGGYIYQQDATWNPTAWRA